MPWISGPGSEGGGSVPVVGAWLYASAAVDLAVDQNPFFVWDTIYDSILENTTLDALPEGLGIDPASIGTDTLTTTVDGLWSFSFLGLSIGPDATWNGSFIFSDLGNAGQTPLPVVASGQRSIPPFTTALHLPSGTGVSFGLSTVDAPTGVSLSVTFGGLEIVRLG